MFNSTYYHYFLGVAITIVMIPLNKFIADKIGSLSTKMMSAKDERVQSMAEMLTGIRVVKFMSWEPYFAEKVHQARTKELKYLKGRKYLDAICVYLWCTTPVLISVLTFATYVLLGNTLTAAKVNKSLFYEPFEFLFPHDFTGYFLYLIVKLKLDFKKALTML